MDEFISEEREFSDEANKYLNDQSAKDELGYEDEIPMESAHSRRARHMMFEYNNQWD